MSALENQIQWYEDMVKDTKAKNGGETVPSLLFFHIPVPEFQEAWDALEAGSPDAKKFDAERWESNEGVAAPKYNSHFFDKVVELGSSKGIFVGHDHINSWAIEYKGVLLSYGITSTDRVYRDVELMGGQVISMDSTNKITLERYFHTYGELGVESWY